MAKYVNQDAEGPVKDVLRANGGTMSFKELKEALEASGQGNLVKDVLNLHLSGKLYGLTKARPNDRPALYLSVNPFPAPTGETAPATSSGASGGTVATNPTGNTANTVQ